MLRIGDLVVFRRTRFGREEVGKYLGTEAGKVVTERGWSLDRVYVVELESGEVVKFNYYDEGWRTDAIGGMYLVLGWLTVKEDYFHTDRGYECAAWFEQIRVPAGTRVPLFCRANSQVDDIDFVYARVAGVIVSDDFGGRFFGMPIGNYDTSKNAGKPSEHTLEWRGYDFAEWMLERRGYVQTNAYYEKQNRRYDIELLPNVEVHQHTFTSYIDGREIAMCNLSVEAVE